MKDCVTKVYFELKIDQKNTIQFYSKRVTRRNSQGEPGSRGPPGPRGTDGADGIDGRDGLPGLDGCNGTEGTDGAPGAPGAPGLKVKYCGLIPCIFCGCFIRVSIKILK